MRKKQNQLPGNVSPNPSGWQSSSCKNLTENIYKSPQRGRCHCSSQSFSRGTQSGCRCWSMNCLQALLWAMLVEGEEPRVWMTVLGDECVQVKVGKVCSWLNPAAETPPVSCSNPGAPTFRCSGTPNKLHHQQLSRCSINGTESKLLSNECGPYMTSPIVKAKEIHAYRALCMESKYLWAQKAVQL